MALSLRQRLLVLMIVAALPGIAVAVYLSVAALEDQSRQIEISAGRLAKFQAAEHRNVIDNARIMLETLTESQALEEIEHTSCKAYLSNWIAKYLTFTSLTLLDAKGEVVCSNLDSDLPFNPAREDWFEQVKTSKGFVLGRYAIGRTGKPVIVAAMPLFDEVTGFQGAVAVGIDLRWLGFLANTIDLPAGGTVTALDATGGILTHSLARKESNGQANGQAASLDSAPSAADRERMAEIGSGTLRGYTTDLKARVYGFRQTEAGGLIVAVGMPPYLAFEQAGQVLLYTLGAPLAVLVLALLATGYASEILITRRVRALTSTAQRMAAGDMSVRSRVPHVRHEIGQLAAAFDAMADAIDSKQAELHAMVTQRETLLHELNHRVKNNMQVVIGLIHVDQDAITADNVHEKLTDLANRIRTLAKMHQLLYRRFELDGNLAAGDTVQQFVDLLRDFYTAEDGRVRIEAEVQPVQLTIDRWISFGLVLNELVSNAYKHAFADGRSGTIRIGLESVRHLVLGARVSLTQPYESLPSEQRIVLTVADDGPGLPEGFDIARAGSTGWKVIRALTQQLDGEITARSLERGTEFELRFPAQMPEAGSA